MNKKYITLFLIFFLGILTLVLYYFYVNNRVIVNNLFYDYGEYCRINTTKCEINTHAREISKVPPAYGDYTRSEDEGLFRQDVILLAYDNKHLLVWDSVSGVKVFTTHKETKYGIAAFLDHSELEKYSDFIESNSFEIINLSEIDQQLVFEKDLLIIEGKDRIIKKSEFFNLVKAGNRLRLVFYDKNNLADVLITSFDQL